MEQIREDELADGGDTQVVDLQQTKRHELALSKVTRELSPEELMQTGTVKMLVATVDRLEAELDEMKDYRERYHEADKRAGSLQARMSSLWHGTLTQEVVSGLALGTGAAIVGFVPSLADSLQGMALTLGMVLILGGIAAKVPRLWLGKEGGR